MLVLGFLISALSNSDRAVQNDLLLGYAEHARAVTDFYKSLMCY